MNIDFSIVVFQDGDWLVCCSQRGVVAYLFFGLGKYGYTNCAIM